MARGLVPHHADEKGAIYCADALDLLRALPDASVGLVLTDPPYFRVKDEDWDHAWENEAAYLAWISELCQEWRRVLKPNGSLYVFASPEMAYGVEGVVRQHFNLLNAIRWEKDAGWHQKQEKESLRSYLSPWETCFFAEQFGDGFVSASEMLHKQMFSAAAARIRGLRERAGMTRREVDVLCSPSRRPTGLCYRWENAGRGHCRPSLEQVRILAQAAGAVAEDVWEQIRKEYQEIQDQYSLARKQFEHLRRPFTPGENWSDTWRYPTVSFYPGKHPCEKPLQMCEDIVCTSSRPGDVVLDTFVGSGATAEAARNLGRIAIVGDADPYWCRKTHERVVPAYTGFGL